MADVTVTSEGSGVYRVEVTSEGSTSTHLVTATEDMIDGIAPGSDPERLVSESFRFLLEREPKESILGSFDLPVIERYFPGYGDEIRRRLTVP